MRAEFISYLAAMRAAISEKVTVDTISPENVGEDGFADLVAILDAIITVPSISSGTDTPTTALGVSGDFYIQSGNPAIVWQKVGSIWANKGNLSIGVVFPDGNSTVKTSLDMGVVTATPGTWFIGNTAYNKLSQTQFTLSAADATLERQDLIYSNTSNQVLLTEGVPGGGQPALPANSVLIDVAVIPSTVSGDDPYLVLGFTDTDATTIVKTTVNATQDDINGTDPYYLPVAYLTDDTIWKASWEMGGVTYYITPDMLQGNNLYGGFPDPNTNVYTIKIVYI